MDATTSIFRTPDVVLTPEGQPIRKDEIRNTADMLRYDLGRYRAWRSHSDADFKVKFKEVQRVQVERMKRTHADFLADDRYAAVTNFFLSDLYGGLDLTELAREVERALPLATRLLPDSVMRTSAVALELNALTGELDEAATTVLFDVLGKTEVNDENLIETYRHMGGFDMRQRQMELLRELGNGLDKYVRSRVIYATFKMANKPAHMAGLGSLYDFLGRGFEVMRPMGSAEEFIDTFLGREIQILNNLESGKPNPLVIN